MNNRIKTIRKSLGLTQDEFAKQLGLQRNTICLFESGKRNPSDRTLDDICNIFNVSIDFLLNGKEPIFIDTPSSTMKKLKSEYHLDEFSYNLVYNYLKLDSKQRQAVRDFFYNVLQPSESIEDLYGYDNAPHTVEELEDKYDVQEVDRRHAN